MSVDAPLPHRRSADDGESLDRRVTRLEVQLGNLGRQLDRQIDADIRVHESTLRMIEKLDTQLETAAAAQAQLSTDFRVFVAKLVAAFAVIAGIGEVLLTIFGPSIRQAAGLK